MKEKKIKLFLADDHHVFREGIRALLENGYAIEVVGEAANGEEVLSQLANLEVNVLLLDVDMPKVNGIDLIKPLFLNYPNVPVLVFSTHDDEQYIHHMMNQGAKGYILKSCRKDELINAIKTVSAGNSYLSKEVSKKLFQPVEKKEKKEKKASNPPENLLTQREIDVLKLVAEGLTNIEIGKILFISHRTVDTHRRNMMTKLDLHNAAALTNYAAQKGLLLDK